MIAALGYIIKSVYFRNLARELCDGSQTSQRFDSRTSIAGGLFQVGQTINVLNFVAVFLVNAMKYILHADLLYINRILFFSTISMPPYVSGHTSQ